MKKALKIGAAVIIGLIVLGYLVGDKKAKSTTTEQAVSTSTSADQPGPEKKWTEVYTFKGNGQKKSQAFALNGGPARLKYKYSGAAQAGGLFSVYVVDEGRDIMKDGGVPEVMTQENEESESYIQKSDGSYYLNVNAVGSWTVSVEQEQ